MHSCECRLLSHSATPLIARRQAIERAQTCCWAANWEPWGCLRGARWFRQSRYPWATARRDSWTYGTTGSESSTQISPASTSPRCLSPCSLIYRYPAIRHTSSSAAFTMRSFLVTVGHWLNYLILAHWPHYVKQKVVHKTGSKYCTVVREGQTHGCS